MFIYNNIMVQLLTYDKVDTANLDMQKRAGFVPYGTGDTKVMVYISPRLGDPSLWLYLMSVGGAAFFASKYVMLKSKTFDILVKKVRYFLKKDALYVLHGVPSKDPYKQLYRQTLLQWDTDLYNNRSKQVLGTFIAQHIGSKINYEMEEEKKRHENIEQKKKLHNENIEQKNKDMNQYIDSWNPFKKSSGTIEMEEVKKGN